MTDLTDDQVKALLDGATPGRRVQFHGSYCPEAVGTPFSDWDTSHDMSVIRPDGSRYHLAHYKHASDAYLSQMAPDLARALLDARADAQAAVALVVERAVEAVEGIRVMFLMATPDDWDEGDNATFEFIKDQLRDLAPDADTAAIRRAAEETGT